MLLSLDDTLNRAVLGHRFFGHRGCQWEQGPPIASAAVFNVMVWLLDNVYERPAYNHGR